MTVLVKICTALKCDSSDYGNYS
ncbi:MAG: hypothetical protein WCD89_05315 [Anaerocolumna sp.]